ncbi:hypothetical protein BGZ58_006988 [Dissophora ornata]|nr:hypothetical protein BGZ58_006988 [Dissophora ornata]
MPTPHREFFQTARKQFAFTEQQVEVKGRAAMELERPKIEDETLLAMQQWDGAGQQSMEISQLRKGATQSKELEASVKLKEQPHDVNKKDAAWKEFQRCKLESEQLKIEARQQWNEAGRQWVEVAKLRRQKNQSEEMEDLIIVKEKLAELKSQMAEWEAQIADMNERLARMTYLKAYEFD